MVAHMGIHGDSTDAAADRPEPVGRERRVVGQALSYWHAVRDHRTLPLLDDLDMEAEPLLRGKLFLMDVTDGPGTATFTYCGGALSHAFKASATGKRPHEVLPSDVAEHMLDLVRAVVDFRRPLADAATLPRVRGGGVLKHRMAIMPVSTDGKTVTHILGAFSYKVD
ncbi:PAS domain-containing protein [Caenispirillum salinarum]|uniref:PAS domain-containing protein n=1 Tax=Caenispirillum salinarum TaxID=859058 RepID=UPI00385110ED